MIVADKENSDIYVWNGPINEDGVGQLVSCTSFQRENAILILSTFGGSANSAYRAARFLQSTYGNFSLLVPSFCKSAGTLLALGANRLLMTEFAELGPLDVQLVKRDELGERRSGLLLRSALTALNEQSTELFSHVMLSIKEASKGLIRFKLASELAAGITQGLLSPIYCQLNPETLGQDHQDLMVAFEYGKRLSKHGGLVSEQQVYQLVHDYPSHDFVIDKQEAETLFKTVDGLSKEMYDLLTALGALAWRPDAKHVTVALLSKSEGSDGENADASETIPKGATTDDE